MITIDTTRADRLGSYGCQENTTPYLDALAQDGIRFDRAWSTSPWTLPSHASLFSGMYPGHHGAHFSTDPASVSLADEVPNVGEFLRVGRLPEHEVTVAELLAEKGYATAAFVGGPWLAPEFGLLQGYEHLDAKVASLAGREAEDITEHAIAWIQDIPETQPVHVFLNYFDPHAPYAPPPEFSSVGGDLKGRELELALYDAEIRYMDHEIGGFLEAMRAAGRFEGALIIVMSDHGELFHEHGLIRHGYWLYEELVRAALIVRLPGGERAGEVVDAMVSGVDVLPLIAHEVGLSLPTDIDGVQVGERRAVISQFHQNRLIPEVRGTRVDRDLAAVIYWPWKLIMSDRRETQLYHLDSDPAELNPLSRGPSELEMRKLLALAGDALTWSSDPVTPETIPPALQEALRSLGYVQ